MLQPVVETDDELFTMAVHSTPRSLPDIVGANLTREKRQRALWSLTELNMRWLLSCLRGSTLVCPRSRTLAAPLAPSSPLSSRWLSSSTLSPPRHRLHLGPLPHTMVEAPPFVFSLKFAFAIVLVLVGLSFLAAEFAMVSKDFLPRTLKKAGKNMPRIRKPHPRLPSYITHFILPLNVSACLTHFQWPW